MDCPNCKKKLAVSDGKSYDCIYCEGSWLSGELIRKLLVENGNNPSIAKLHEYLQENSENHINRFCPECADQRLYLFNTHSIEIDFCSKCDGVFF